MEGKKEFNHLVRIANTDLEGKKHLNIALTKIKGIGRMLSAAICELAKLDKTAKIGYLSENDVNELTKIIESIDIQDIPAWLLNRRKDPESGLNNHLLTSDLKFSREQDIKKKMKIKSYKGLRHSLGLTVRGQKTKANFRKNKGKGPGVKKKASAKGGRV